MLNNGKSIENISKKLKLPLGTRHIKGSIKWYCFCIVAKQNQKKAILKHPDLYSKAGKIAQKKHPLIGYKLGKKYGREQGLIRAAQLKGNKEYFSNMAKRLHELNPEHSRQNMRKAHDTLKRKGTFKTHQKNAALSCMKQHPNQLKEMSKRAHELHPLALLALESRRNNYPYEYMNCLFDSDSERKVCEIFVQKGLMINPREGENIHFRIKRCHVDFFIKRKVFVEFHPPINYGQKKGETMKSYYAKKRTILDKNGYQEYPLIVIDRIKGIESKINRIKKLLTFKTD